MLREGRKEEDWNRSRRKEKKERESTREKERLGHVRFDEERVKDGEKR